MELTPMMQQYQATKAQHPGEILFFRLGDFYEMFFDDARLVAGELGLTLTSRSGNKDKAPMCGIPYHAAESYINRLIAKGYKVAIAEQIGDPKAKGLTKREVIKVVTPGTVLSESALPETSNNYIALLYEPPVQEKMKDDTVVLAGADISTGECFYGIYTGANRLQLLFDELYRLQMAELLLVGELSFRAALDDFVHLRLGAISMTASSSILTRQTGRRRARRRRRSRRCSIICMRRSRPTSRSSRTSRGSTRARISRSIRTRSATSRSRATCATAARRTRSLTCSISRRRPWAAAC